MLAVHGPIGDRCHSIAYQVENGMESWKIEVLYRCKNKTLSSIRTPQRVAMNAVFPVACMTLRIANARAKYHSPLPFDPSKIICELEDIALSTRNEANTNINNEHIEQCLMTCPSQFKVSEIGEVLSQSACSYLCYSNSDFVGYIRKVCQATS